MLIRPIKKIEFIIAIQLAFTKYTTETVDIKLRNKIYRIAPEMLKYIRADHIYTELNFTNKKLVLGCPLRELVDLMPQGTIVRINRSTAINPNFISHIAGQYIMIDDIPFKASPKIITQNEILIFINKNTSAKYN